MVRLTDKSCEIRIKDKLVGSYEESSRNARWKPINESLSQSKQMKDMHTTKPGLSISNECSVSDAAPRCQRQ